MSEKCVHGRENCPDRCPCGEWCDRHRFDDPKSTCIKNLADRLRKLEAEMEGASK